MVEMPLLDEHHIPGGTLQGGVDLANRLRWNMTRGTREGIYYVWAGDTLLLSTDSRETAEAFLYGLGLAFGSIPDVLFEQFEAMTRRMVGEE